MESVKENMSDFKDMYEEQASFQELLYDKNKMNYEEKMALSKEYILSAHKELSEVLDVFPWKTHRKSASDRHSNELLAEELIDSIKFILNIFYIWDFRAYDIIKAFYKKSQVVRDRLKDE